MMYKHNKGAKVLHLLAWVAGVLFFWTMFKGTMIYGLSSMDYAASVVVLILLAKTCGGYRHGMMGGKVCSHEAGCKCGDCDRCH